MKIRLTADACALAVVAAARSYGDHPLRALTVARGKLRRSVAPAAHALVEATGADVARVCAVLGASVATYQFAARENARSFQAARQAAVEALLVRGERQPAPQVAETPAGDCSETPDRERPQRTDHREAIKAALAKQGPASIKVTVAGVEIDKAALNRAGAGGCRWHLHRVGVETPCDAPVVKGRLFCADHCLAMGQKATPLDLPPPRMPAPYTDRSGSHG